MTTYELTAWDSQAINYRGHLLRVVRDPRTVVLWIVIADICRVFENKHTKAMRKNLFPIHRRMVSAAVDSKFGRTYQMLQATNICGVRALLQDAGKGAASLLRRLEREAWGLL